MSFEVYRKDVFLVNVSTGEVPRVDDILIINYKQYKVVEVHRIYQEFVDLNHREERVIVFVIDKDY